MPSNLTHKRVCYIIDNKIFCISTYVYISLRVVRIYYLIIRTVLLLFFFSLLIVNLIAAVDGAI